MRYASGLMARVSDAGSVLVLARVNGVPPKVIIGRVARLTPYAYFFFRRLSHVSPSQIVRSTYACRVDGGRILIRRLKMTDIPVRRRCGWKEIGPNRRCGLNAVDTGGDSCRKRSGLCEGMLSFRRPAAYPSGMGHRRILTSLLDPARYSPAELTNLYHRRWDIETFYRDFKETMRPETGTARHRTHSKRNWRCT